VREIVRERERVRVSKEEEEEEEAAGGASVSRDVDSPCGTGTATVGVRLGEGGIEHLCTGSSGREAVLPFGSGAGGNESLSLTSAAFLILSLSALFL
jgi:hypothetical protein